MVINSLIVLRFGFLEYRIIKSTEQKLLLGK